VNFMTFLSFYGDPWRALCRARPDILHHRGASVKRQCGPT